VTGLTAGASYGFSGQVRIPATSDAFTYRLEIRWMNAGDATIRTDTVKTYRAATSGWNRASTTTAAPRTTTKAQVRLVAGSLNTTIYVDNLLFQRG
jgi:hypothetical protein